MRIQVTCNTTKALEELIEWVEQQELCTVEIKYVWTSTSFYDEKSIVSISPRKSDNEAMERFYTFLRQLLAQGFCS